MKFIILYVSYLICYIANSVKSTSTETSIKSENTNTIFGSFKMFNHNDKANLKITKVEKNNAKTNKIGPPTVSVGDINLNGAYKGIQNSISKLESNKAPGKLDSIQGPAYTGWIQYFKWSSNKSNLKKPSKFYKNEQFFIQEKHAYGKTPAPDFKSKDANGEYLFIPDQTHFYVTLFERTFNVANSKEVNIFLNDK